MTEQREIPDHIFRGYDIRGVVGEDLDTDVMELLGKGYGTFLFKRRINEAVVGRDNRITGEEYEKSFIYGLRKTGVNVYDFGLGLSQIMYFSQYLFRSKGGAFITASHNPKNFNGMKLAVGFSQTMMSSEIQELREIIKSGRLVAGEKIGEYKEVNVFPEYKKDLLKRIDLRKKFKIVVDSCNGAAGAFLPEIFREFGCEVIEQNTNLDGNFPNGTPDPTEKKVQERLARRVIEEKADVGFSYDADGDRMGVVDENGGLIWNDNLVTIFALDILDYLPGSKIIFNTLCSKQVPEAITAAGGIPIIWATGHSYIKAKVAEERAPFGGELSGHFFFCDNFFGHDDGAYSSLRLLSYLSRKNKTLGQVISSLPHYFSSPEIKLGCPDNLKFELIKEKIAPSLKKLYTQAKFIDIDGIRMDSEFSMAVIRASQNGPYITVKFEAKTNNEYDKTKKIISAILHQYPEIDFLSGVNIEALD